MQLFSRTILMLGALLGPLAAEFVPPAEGPVPFRRDRLPLDVETMAALSRQVMSLARTSANFPKPPREVAQMTALALALDPANREARDLIEAMKAGTPPEADGQEDVERARNRAWQVLAWLETPEAGADGQALAACLGDVLAVADPRHPKALERQAAGEQGAWKNWVAELADFRTKPSDPTADPELMTDPEPPATRSETLGQVVALNELETSMPLWYLDNSTEQMKLGMVRVGLKATVMEQSEAKAGGFRLGMAGTPQLARLSKAFREVEMALKQRHGSLPERSSAQLDLGKTVYSLPRNGLALTGTAALLLDGAIAGKAPTATTLAVVGADGKLELPPRFWQTLRGMAELPESGRLILPDAAADYLTALLVLEDAAFFMRNEVLLAGTVDELCDLASADPKAEIADGFKRFEDIRKVGQGKPLGPFVAHQSTLQRLRELAAAMPRHASARLLALQGSGNRPRFLQRSILARQIRTALEPVAYVTTKGYSELDPSLLDQAHEASRKQLDETASVIDIRDRDLQKAAVDVADSLRAVARLLQKKDDYYTTALVLKQRGACKAAVDEYLRVLALLTEAAGDAADFPPPKVVPPDE